MTVVNYRPRQSQVRDQGNRPTCAAFAVSAAHEDQTADGVDLSPEFVYWGSKRIDGLPPREATTLNAAVTVLSRVGEPPEVEWAYDEGTDSAAPNYAPSLKACRAAWGRRVPGIAFIPPTAGGLVQILDLGDGVVLGIQLYKTWHVAGTNGRISMPDPGMAALGGHAVFVVGYRTGRAATEFVVKNSWGASWGDQGYGYLPATYVDMHGIVACRL